MSELQLKILYRRKKLQKKRLNKTNSVKIHKKLMIIVNIEEENLYIPWTTWGISMKFSGKMTYSNIKNHKKSGLHSLPFSVSVSVSLSISLSLPVSLSLKVWN